MIDYTCGVHALDKAIPKTCIHCAQVRIRQLEAEIERLTAELRQSKLEQEADAATIWPAVERTMNEIERLQAESTAVKVEWKENADSLNAEIERLKDGMELAWGLIANAYVGDWDRSSEASGWKKAAERWRDEQWHPMLDRMRLTTDTDSKGGSDE